MQVSCNALQADPSSQCFPVQEHVALSLSDFVQVQLQLYATHAAVCGTQELIQDAKDGCWMASY